MTEVETQLVDTLTHLAATDTDFMTDIGPLLLSAVALELAADTRGFARMFDVAHALVIRECTQLQDDLGLLYLENREERSGRLFLSLSEKGRMLCDQAEGARL